MRRDWESELEAAFFVVDDDDDNDDDRDRAAVLPRVALAPPLEKDLTMPAALPRLPDFDV